MAKGMSIKVRGQQQQRNDIIYARATTPVLLLSNRLPGAAPT